MVARLARLSVVYKTSRFVVRGQLHGAVLRDQKAVFDAYAGFAGEVDAGFEHDNHAPLQPLFAVGDDARVLVAADADAVAAVVRVDWVAGRLDGVAHGAVDLLAYGARPQQRRTQRQRCAGDAVHLPLARRRLARHVGGAAVAPVTVLHHADVHDQRVAQAQPVVLRPAADVVGARAHYAVVADRHAAAGGGLDGSLDRRPYLDFAGPGNGGGTGGSVADVAQGEVCPQLAQFLLILDQAQRRQPAVDRNQLLGQCPAAGQQPGSGQRRLDCLGTHAPTQKGTGAAQGAQHTAQLAGAVQLLIHAIALVGKNGTVRLGGKGRGQVSPRIYHDEGKAIPSVVHKRWACGEQVAPDLHGWRKASQPGHAVRVSKDGTVDTPLLQQLAGALALFGVHSGLSRKASRKRSSKLCSVGLVWATAIRLHYTAVDWALVYNEFMLDLIIRNGDHYRRSEDPTLPGRRRRARGSHCCGRQPQRH